MSDSASRTDDEILSLWADVTVAPPDPIFDLMHRYRADPHPEKLDLSVGAYRDEQGKPYVLPVVAETESRMAAEVLDKEYLPISGLGPFVEASVRILLGDDSPAIIEKRVGAVQALSGTGAIRIAAEFYARFAPNGKKSAVYISNPTWVNHAAIFRHSGFDDIRTYPYYVPEGCKINVEGMRETLAAAPRHSIVVLQLCAHNPTGLDLSLDEWRQLADVLLQTEAVVLLDSAYQGYASGDTVRDAAPARLLEDAGLEFCTCQSYSKNFGLYGERVGCVSFLCASPEIAQAITSQLKWPIVLVPAAPHQVIIRPMYSNPPTHGARIVERILTDPDLYTQWKNQVAGMAGRIREMRTALRSALESRGTPPPKGCADWSHITRQIGMFSYLGLSADACGLLVDKFHVYLPQTARISVAGLSSTTVPRLAAAIHYAQTVGTAETGNPERPSRRVASTGRVGSRAGSRSRSRQRGDGDAASPLDSAPSAP